MQKTDLSEQVLPLSPVELEKIRVDFRQGLFGVILAGLILSGFTWLFAVNIPNDTLFGSIFIWSPLILGAVLSPFLLFYLFNLRRDLRAGIKERVSGTIIKKQFRSTPKLSGSTLTSLTERSRHLITVDGQEYLIRGSDYENCRAGNKVLLYVTPYTRRVLSFESPDPDYDSF